MNLLSSLCSGFAQAANGTAEIYIRDTSTRATVYGDFEASTSDSSGADIDLDAWGAAEVYVNQLVDVVVKDSDGVTVRSFTDGYASPNVEVISPAFTGTDYVTAASGVSEPTTLQAVLDRWVTNSGAPDWKVDIDGTATTLANALGALSGLVFNVKSPAYGAVGDGVVNDQPAIAAALAAAVAAGGGTVFFPKGTYKISTAIEWSHLVNIVGVGARLSVISQSSAANARILTWTSGTARSDPQHIIGMGFSASQANSGEQLYATVSVNLALSGCGLGLSLNCTGNLLRLASGGRLAMRSCRADCSGNGFAMYLGDPTYGSFYDCWFGTTYASYDQELVRLDNGAYSFVGCEFDATSVTFAPTDLHGATTVSASATLAMVGCKFLTSAQAFTSCLSLIGGAMVTTSGNNFGSSTRYTMAGSALGNGSHLELAGTDRLASNTTTPTITSGVEVYEFSSTGTKPTWTMPTGFFRGQRLIVLAYNGSGGNWALGSTFTGADVSGAVTIAQVNATTSAAYQFVYSDLLSSGTYTWFLYSAD